MARYKGASCRLCRREGEKLFLKGQRCYTDKCAISRRSYAPGQHGQQKKKMSEYGIQLREKQKAKRVYGILESQFRRYFEIAANKRGVTGQILIETLEKRLDNVVFRMGMGASRQEARQLITHGHFLVNGKKVDIPSYIVKVGDEIAANDKFKASPRVEMISNIAGSKVIPEWLEVSRENWSGRVVALPAKEYAADVEIKDHLIVELYSK